MKKIIVLLCLAIGSATLLPLQAQTGIPAPYTEVKGQLVISGFHHLTNTSTPDNIFAKALLYTIENQDPDGEENQPAPLLTDYDKKQYTFELVLNDPGNATRYRCNLSVKVADNIITVLASDITCEAEINIVKLVRRLPFEKLQPEKNPKHADYLTGFAAACQKQTQALLQAVDTPEQLHIEHWKEIRNKDIVKDMTKTECLLALGKPASIQKQNNREEWMYDSYTYLFFEGDKVISIIR